MCSPACPAAVHMQVARRCYAISCKGSSICGFWYLKVLEPVPAETEGGLCERAHRCLHIHSACRHTLTSVATYRDMRTPTRPLHP